jgi:HSP20 family protein
MMSFFDKLKGDINTEEDAKKTKPAPTNKRGKAEIKKEVPQKPQKAELAEQKPTDEAELAIDVFETDDNIVIQSTIGGIKAEDLDIDIENDMVTIRGSRQNKIEEKNKKYFYQECYWGAFMRKVILPEEVDANKAKAVIKDGVLTLSMPKVHRKLKKKIAIEQEE